MVTNWKACRRVGPKPSDFLAMVPLRPAAKELTEKSIIDGAA